MNQRTPGFSRDCLDLVLGEPINLKAAPTCQQNEAAVGIGSLGPGSPLIKRIVGRLRAFHAGFGPLQRFFMKLQDFACGGYPMDARRNRPAQGGGH
ncbi:hypothetical protein [Novosphingobium sp. ERW19]|uniref:hypothetical protein n=1 Tax=Novosphingobium sp. ERW19 TaxID=2726186 RepID=UPI001456D5A6|nr:hypothetical protein [Novosphingobium sp. ERW19]NLR41445.1 hypothetical protein [Novosphingobium sp. ERW19]